MHRFLSISFLLISSLLVSITSIAQEVGKPFLKNYPPKVYEGAAQNWSITQDARGVLYIGNGDGVVEYDGTDWHTTHLPNKITVRSIEVADNQVVYVGATKGFGYLSVGDNGETVYNSLDEQLPDSVRSNLQDIWSLSTVGNTAYFVSRPYLFRYANGKLDYWEPKDLNVLRFRNPFILKGVFHVTGSTPRGKPTKVLIDKDGELVASPHQFNNIRQSGSTLIPYKEDTVILGNGRNYFFKYPISDTPEKDSLGLLNELNTYVAKYNRLYTDGIPYDGGYALGSVGSGVLLFDEQYKFLGTINKNENGLISDQTYYLFGDRDGAVWSGNANGLARIDLSSEVTFWDDDAGLRGAVYHMTRFKGDLYINTALSIYMLKGNKIELVPNAVTSTQCWDLLNFKNPDNPEDDRLLLATRVIYDVSRDGLKLVSNGFGSETLFKLYQDPDSLKRVWIATRSGLASMLWDNGNWKKEIKIPGMTENCRSIIKDKEGNIWVGSYRNGVFKFTQKANGKWEFDIKHYTEEEGLLSMANPMFYEVGGEIVLATGKGICQYNSNTDRFEPYTKFGTEFSDGSRDVYRLDEDAEGNVWITGEMTAKSPAVVLRKQSDGSYKVDTKPFKKIPPMTAEAVFADNNGVAWVGGSEGLYRYSPHSGGSKVEQEYATLVRRVIAGKDSVLFAGNYSMESDIGVRVATTEQLQSQAPVIPADLNSIDFYFAAPFFDNEEQTQYKYYLEGFDKGWSQWTNRRDKEYTNLSGGKYTFKVKSKNLYGNESSIATYEFTVMYPWYLRWWAIAAYIFVAVVIIRAAVKFNAKRLERENERLEGIIEQRTAEITMQAENLRNLNEEISAVNESLSTKTEALEKANANMNHLSAIGKTITSTLDIREVIRIIYESINELLDASGFGVGVYRPEENILEFKGYMERGEALDDHYESVVDDHDSVALQVFTSGQRFFSNDVEADFAKSEKNMRVIQGDTPKSMIYMPLAYGDEVIGVITVQSFEANAYTENDINIFQNVASYASIALANAKGYEVIQEKNKSITDSIRYSQTMQNAFLPSVREMMDLGDHFVFYRPRDIVSGDFYWILNLPRQNKLFVAAVDCTGHGVPGSFMSIVGATLLNEIVAMKHVYEPNQILEELNQGVITTLNQHDEGADSNDDGMDVCLCVMEKGEDDTTSITFCGAKNDLLFVRKGSTELEYLHGDNKLIGGMQKKGKVFTNKKVDLQKGDCIYLATDGFVDQHNAYRQKYGSLNLRDLLVEIAPLPMGDQYSMLEKTFENHQGQMEQRDDVTVLGIKL